MLGHIEMQHLATIVFQEDKYEQHPHGHCGHGKEIDGDQLADMVVQEGPPRLVRWPPEPAQDARHGALGEGDAEHLQLAMNPGCAPQRIGGGYFARSIGGVLRLCRGDLDVAAAGWTTWPRICGNVRAANGRRCLPGHKARDVASRTTRCGE